MIFGTFVKNIQKTLFTQFTNKLTINSLPKPNELLIKFVDKILFRLSNDVILLT